MLEILQVINPWDETGKHVLSSIVCFAGRIVSIPPVYSEIERIARQKMSRKSVFIWHCSRKIAILSFRTERSEVRNLIPAKRR